MHDDIALLWSRIEPRLIIQGSCWVWTGSTNGRYGTIKRRGQTLLTHRISYLANKGEIPDGFHIDHLCRNTRCSNPAHLEAVTPRVNVRRQHGPFADRAAQSHCIHGHKFTPANTYTRANGTRVCRACTRESAAARYRRAS